ncbi:MAG: tryptophan-rich sensory protein [Muribaculaceae bacterium]|nr:tryptophan-rich sensory protein [Muribaculaceae bacterium]
MKKTVTIIVAIAICLIVGYASQYLQADAIDTWYPMLIKPSITPPNAACPIAWGIIYVCMGISVGLIWHRPYFVKLPMVWLFVWQLFLNLMWSVLFFAMQSPMLGLIDIVMLDITVLLYAVNVYKLNKLSSLLFLPYILWLALATYLNAYILAAN